MVEQNPSRIREAHKEIDPFLDSSKKLADSLGTGQTSGHILSFLLLDPSVKTLLDDLGVQYDDLAQQTYLQIGGDKRTGAIPLDELNPVSKQAVAIDHAFAAAERDGLERPTPINLLEGILQPVDSVASRLLFPYDVKARDIRLASNEKTRPRYLATRQAKLLVRDLENGENEYPDDIDRITGSIRVIRDTLGIIGRDHKRLQELRGIDKSRPQ